MSETDNIQLICYSANLLIHLSAYTIFTMLPFKGFYRFNDRKSALYVLLGFAYFLVTNLLVYEKTSPLKQFKGLFTILTFAIVVWIFLKLVNRKPKQIIFTMVIMFTFQHNIIITGMLLTPLIFKAPLIVGFADFNYILTTIIVLIFAIPEIWYISAGLLRQMVSNEFDMRNFKYLFFMPLAYYFFGFFLQRYGGLGDNGVFGAATFIIYRICVYLSYITVFKMLLLIGREYENNIKIEVMDKQLQMQNENYKKLNEYLNETSRLRHDMRHHMHVIADFARNSNFEEINRYITSFEDENMLRSEAPVCKNKTVDVILRHYMGIAAGGGVDVKLQVDLPKELSISDTELCVIFGNLAENAQEACLKSQEKRAFIDIKAYVRGSQLIMCFSNSYSGEIHREEKNFFSTKHAGVGIGISSVMAIAKRHGGDVKITTENNIFKAYVMLNLE